MMKLDERQRKCIAEARGKLSLLSVGDEPTNILDAIALCVPSVAGLLAVVRPGTFEGFSNHSLRLPVEVFQGWLSTSPANLERALIPVFQSKPGDFWRESDAVMDDAREGLEEVLDVLDGFGLSTGAGYKIETRVLPGQPSEHVFMSLMPERKADFPLQAPAMLGALVGDVRDAIARMSLPLIGSKSLLWQLMEDVEIGYIALALKSGVILEMNRRAHELFMRYREAARVPRGRGALLEFIDLTRQQTLSRREWVLQHADKTGALVVRLLSLPKARHALSQDMYLLALQEFQWAPIQRSQPRRIADSPHLAGLTPRQREIAILLAEEALSYKEGADALGISMGTFRKHAEQIYRALGVHSRQELAVLLKGKGET